MFALNWLSSVWPFLLIGHVGPIANVAASSNSRVVSVLLKTVSPVSSLESTHGRFFPTFEKMADD